MAKGDKADGRKPAEKPETKAEQAAAARQKRIEAVRKLAKGEW